MYYNIIVYLYIYLIIKFSFIDNEFFIVFGLLIFLFIASFKLKTSIRKQYLENTTLLSANILEFIKIVVLFFFNWLNSCSYNVNYIKKIFNLLFQTTNVQYKFFRLSSLVNDSNNVSSFLSLINFSSRLNSLLLLNMSFQMLINNGKLISSNQKANFISTK